MPQFVRDLRKRRERLIGMTASVKLVSLSVGREEGGGRKKRKVEVMAEDTHGPDSV